MSIVRFAPIASHRRSRKPSSEFGGSFQHVKWRFLPKIASVRLSWRIVRATKDFPTPIDPYRAVDATWSVRSRISFTISLGKQFVGARGRAGGGRSSEGDLGVSFSVLVELSRIKILVVVLVLVPSGGASLSDSDVPTAQKV